MRRTIPVLFLLALLFANSDLTAQNKHPFIEILDSGMQTSLRGLSVVNDNIVWVSGSNGVVGRSSNGGKNWKWITVKGFEKNDFRDIEAFDASTAVMLSIGEPAYILKTHDGGESWKIVYENKTKGMFLDAFDFSTPANGIVIGDPVDGHFFMAKTTDGGETWNSLTTDERPTANTGEAFFAASGTNISLLYNQSLFLASGGVQSHLFINNEKISIPILQGRETTGANSVAVWDDYRKNAGSRIIIVGGDFNHPDSTRLNCAYSENRGRSWKQPHTAPHGYRSCVEYLSKKEIISCGLNGVDYSYDGGKNWSLISNSGFHSCQAAKFGTAVFLSGNNGKIARLRIN
ncbi:MAG: oxidoreductase [Terrimonas sp.]|nr:oxidoreductase [Terrimonas sp.]